MSSKSFKQITQDLNKAITTFRESQPGTMGGFATMAKSALAPGVLSAIDKELIALAIGVAARCEGCLGFHVGTLACLGVSREQFMETLAVAVYMGGGPSLMFAAEAVQACEEFAGLS